MTGGYFSALAMIKKIQENKRIVKERKYFNGIKNTAKKQKKSKYADKKATPEQLEAVRQKIKRQNLWNGPLSLIVLLASIVGAYYILKLVGMMFS